MRRVSIAAISSVIALAILGTAALAKGGAITKFDQLPSEWHAGQNYTLGYTILMDGTQPYKADVTEIVIRGATGKVLSYPGTPSGADGHYVAKIYFPAAGTYTWQVTQGSFFPPTELGSITVLAPSAAAGEAATASRSADAAPFLALAASLIAIGALVLARRARRRAPLPA